MPMTDDATVVETTPTGGAASMEEEDPKSTEAMETLCYAVLAKSQTDTSNLSMWTTSSCEIGFH